MGTDVNCLFSSAYDRLRNVASKCLAMERRNHTLQPTELVNEVYLRIADYNRIHWNGQAHFVALAVRIMRQILVNHAIARRAAKRGGDRSASAIDDTVAAFSARSPELLELDAALQTLSSCSERLVQVVELRFFGGFSVPDVASVLGVSVSTVERDWATARAWLHRRLTNGS